MRKRWIIGATALVAVALGTVGVLAATAETGQARISESAFLQLVRGKYAVFAGSDDSALITAGKGVCAMFDSGRTTDSIYDIMWVDDLGSDNGLSLIAYSVRTFCPEYAGEIR